jgi:hypothetical protein
MADSKQGRDKQAHDAERRQRQREIEEELERMDDPEPPVDTSELAYFETELEAMEFPATGAEVVETVGDHELESVEGNYTVGKLVPDTEAKTFDSPAAVREQVQRPTIAAAMKRVVEESQTLQGENLSGSQYEAYGKTFMALKSIDADDDDEGIQAISDWIVERIHEKEKLPESRAVRRQAAKFCRSEGYEIRNDEWLGI